MQVLFAHAAFVSSAFTKHSMASHFVLISPTSLVVPYIDKKEILAF
jgi:hypothetical protein